MLSLQELRRNLFVIKKSSKQNLNKEITRHKDAVSKLDEAMKTIERLKSVIQVSLSGLGPFSEIFQAKVSKPLLAKRLHFESFDFHLSTC